MIIIDTVNFIAHIDCKWNTVQALITNTTSETAGMIRFAHSLQNLCGKNAIMNIYLRYGAKYSSEKFTYHFHNQMSAYGALFSCLLEARVLKFQITIMKLSDLFTHISR